MHKLNGSVDQRIRFVFTTQTVKGRSEESEAYAFPVAADEEFPAHFRYEDYDDRSTRIQQNISRLIFTTSTGLIRII